jgi:hypothetical protein
MTYNKNTDVLSVEGSADVRLTDEGGNTLTQFTAGTALFTRPTHLLTLGGTVHALHNEQVFDAGNGSAQLSEDDSTIQAMALRDKASVTGGGQGLESMSGDAIDLDYADDGARSSMWCSPARDGWPGGRGRRRGTADRRRPARHEPCA